MTKFVDIDKIGSGGFGVVIKCKRDPDGELFARKLLLLEDEGSIKRFQREVRILSKLAHPRIIRIEDTHVDAKPYWFVMPLYKNSLRDVMPSVVGDRKEIAAIFESVLEGMDYAHEQGVIHRDLKPENILHGDDGSIVVSDFGLGRALDAASSRATRSGDWVGTMGYMAPEQVSNAAHADARSDIFSLGRILYELLTGESPLAIQDVTKLPVGLAQVVQRCTRTNPDERFQTVRDLRTSFVPVAISHAKPSAAEALKQLVGQISAQQYTTEEQTANLAQLVAQCHDEPDVLHEVAVSLPERAFTTLERAYPEMAKVLATVFSQVAVSQSWPFDYTDRIGTACSRIYDATSDNEIKALMVVTALEVGTSHNRYYVMDVAAALISRAREEATALAIAHALEKRKGWPNVVRGRIEVKKLHPILKELAEIEEDEQ